MDRNKKKTEILGLIEKICGITKNDIRMHSMFDAKEGVQQLTHIVNRTENTELSEDVNKSVSYGLLRIMEDIDENYPLWNDISRLYDRVK